MKNAKLSIFVLALTLSIGVSSGVYACEQNETTKGARETSVAQKMDLKDVKNQQWDAKFLENHADKKNFDKNHKDLKKGIEHKYDKIKPVISVEDKAALKVKIEEISTVKEANKVLKTTINKNTEAVKVELKRIEDSKIVVDPVVKNEADSVLLAVKDATTRKDCVKPLVPTVLPVSVVTPLVPVVEPVVPVLPVEKTYLEKLNERLDNALINYTETNTELTTLGTRLLSLLNALTLIK